uniref:hypothetical protein n=1 Tax=Nonomuraea pusilla TaxID=46177 RepID=UPI0006E3AE7C|nr:hypothetical protein [Nonomuraea pusilla]
MAFSQDKGSPDRGRHRRGRWWRRGSYLFSRRREAPPDAARSFWSSARSEVRRGLRGDRERSRLFRERPATPEARDVPEARDEGRGPQERRTDDRPRWGSRPERLSAAVAEQPAYTWHDFELDDAPPRARPDLPGAPSRGDGLRHCGKLESILHRQWDARFGPPSADAVRAVESLARLPERLKEMLAAGLEGVYIGPGGVPDLDDMGYLRNAPLPSGRATWDMCAGAYGDRKIVVGDRPSPTPDVMMHEVGHAIDDLDSAHGEWVSDSPEFVALYEKVAPLLVSAFHRQPGGLGRKEFFADAFAAIASRQRPALVDMLGGDTRTALTIMLFFNRRYGI